MSRAGHALASLAMGILLAALALGLALDGTLLDLEIVRTRILRAPEFRRTLK